MVEVGRPAIEGTVEIYDVQPLGAVGSPTFSGLSRTYFKVDLSVIVALSKSYGLAPADIDRGKEMGGIECRYGAWVSIAR